MFAMPGTGLRISPGDVQKWTCELEWTQSCTFLIISLTNHDRCLERQSTAGVIGHSYLTLCSYLCNEALKGSRGYRNSGSPNKRIHGQWCDMSRRRRSWGYGEEQREKEVGHSAVQRVLVPWYSAVKETRKRFLQLKWIDLQRAQREWVISSLLGYSVSCFRTILLQVFQISSELAVKSMPSFLTPCSWLECIVYVYWDVDPLPICLEYVHSSSFDKKSLQPHGKVVLVSEKYYLFVCFQWAIV